MKKFLLVLFALFSLGTTFVYAASMVERAYAEKKSNVQVQGVGQVVKVLKDDNDGIRHQKFLLKLASNSTVLLAHNVDLGSRLDGLKEGDVVEFYGEFEWNNKGGIIHWTHHDPRKKHIDGWLKYNGKIYQ